MEFTIEAFVEKLLEEKGVKGLEPEVMTQLKKDLVDRAENMINAEILSSMPESVLPEFEQVLDTQSEEQIKEFCTKHIPNIDEVTSKALLKLKDTYLSTTL